MDCDFDKRGRVGVAMSKYGGYGDIWKVWRVWGFGLGVDWFGSCWECVLRAGGR
jgi:hypothetical protein